MFNRIRHSVKFNVMDAIVRKTASMCASQPCLLDEVTEVLEDNGWTLEQYLAVLAKENTMVEDEAGDQCWA